MRHWLRQLWCSWSCCHILCPSSWCILEASIVTVYEIIANKTFTVTNGLISWLFVVTFVHPTYVWITLIWGFPAQLSLWKSVHWLWKYKLNEVCNNYQYVISQISSSQIVDLVFLYFIFHFYFHSVLFFHFLFLEQLELGLIGHTVTPVTTWWHSHKTDYETWENLVEDSKNKWRHIT